MGCRLSALVLRLLNFVLLVAGLALCATPFLRYASLCHVPANQLATVHGFWILAALGGGLVFFSLLGCCAASGKAKYKRPYIALLVTLVGASVGAYFWQNAQGAIEGKVSDLASATLGDAFKDFATLYHAGDCAGPHCPKCPALESVLDDCPVPAAGTRQAQFVDKCNVQFSATSDCGKDCVNEFCVCEATGAFALDELRKYMQIGLLCLGGFFLTLLVLVLCVKQKRDFTELHARMIEQPPVLVPQPVSAPVVRLH